MVKLKQEKYKGFNIHFIETTYYNQENYTTRRVRAVIYDKNTNKINHYEVSNSKISAFEMMKNYIDNINKLKIGDEVKVNMKIVEQYDNIPPYLKLVRKVIRDGDKYPYIYSFDGNKAEISGTPFGIGSVFVPIGSLNKK